MGSATITITLADTQSKTAPQLLCIPIFQTKVAATKASAPKLLALPATLKALDKAAQGALSETIQAEAFSGKKNQTLRLSKRKNETLPADHILLIGLGEEHLLRPDKFEKLLSKAIRQALGLSGIQHLAIDLNSAELTAHLKAEQIILLATDAIRQATYASREALEAAPAPKTASLILGRKITASDQQALKKSQAISTGRSLAKDLANMPSNTKCTDTLVATARSIAKASGGCITVTVESNPKILEKEMPSFFEVARGSLASDPPKFITLTYTPEGSKKSKRTLALIGKSVIFDTGGYQVKPGDFMVTMKGDMTGGATVLGVMQTLCELQPKNITVKAYLAATPNKIDSAAMLPDAIIGSTCGKKIEIRHTDAEGRLTLIDAVSKAAAEKPDAIVTIATLTGSAGRAVGSCIALMANDTDWRDQVEAAARYVGDPVQTLDVIEEDYDDIKSKLDGANIINTSHNKSRGAQSAAAFVMSGLPEKHIPLAHLDIAGGDMTSDEKATGIAHKALAELVLRFA